MGKSAIACWSGSLAIQWFAVGQMEKSRAEAATATPATRADLLRNGDAARCGFRCREAALGRLVGKRGYLRDVVGVQDTVGPSVGRANAPAV